MANESIDLNLIPKGEMPVIHVSQFDNGRQFNINLLKGSDEYTLPAGYTAVLNCRKADRNIVTLATTSVLSNTLTFTTTTQLCACAGKNICEVVIKDAEDFNVGTLNFILEVEKDPLQGGIESTSEIHDLEDQIEDITTEIISENYYTKTETDTLLDAKADASSLATVATSGSYNDLNNVPKINGITISGNKTAQWYGLASKLNDLSDVTLSLELSEFETLIYNPSLNKWINSKMSYQWLIDKPSIPAAQVQSDYAQVDNTQVDYIKNKPDINGMIAAAIYDIMPESTVTGACASFNTDFEKPLTALTASNSATKILQCGGNSTLGNYLKNVYEGTYGFIDLGTLNFSYESGWNSFKAEISDAKRVPSGAANALCAIYTSVPGHYSGDTQPDMTMGINTSSHAAGVCTFRNTQYGSDAAAFKTAMSGYYLIYELENTATPSITDSQFEAICNSFDADNDVYILPVSTNPTTYNGDNNFFTDNGDITVSYKESIQHYIDRKTGD